MERGQRDFGIQSLSTSADQIRSASNLTDSDTQQAAGIVRWLVNTGQDTRQARCLSVWSTQRLFHDSQFGGHAASVA